jgi:hypothetical protein
MGGLATRIGTPAQMPSMEEEAASRIAALVTG